MDVSDVVAKNENFLNSIIGISIGLVVFLCIIAIAIVVFQIIAMVKVYKKAGKAGWEAIIPFYNTWVLCEITNVKKYWFFFMAEATAICTILGLAFLNPLAALITLAANFAINYNLAIKFGKDPVGYGIGLTLLPVIFYAILGFGSATFTDAKVSAYGPIAEEKIEKKETAASEPKKEDTDKEEK